jgi:hypothetical protein
MDDRISPEASAEGSLVEKPPQHSSDLMGRITGLKAHTFHQDFHPLRKKILFLVKGYPGPAVRGTEKNRSQVMNPRPPSRGKADGNVIAHRLFRKRMIDPGSA